MKSILLCLLSLLFYNCSHAPNSEHMRQFVFMKEKSATGGIVEYADITSSTFVKQPEEIAKMKMSQHCKKGYSITKETSSLRTRNFGTISKENPWKTIFFKCK